jgi:hypothetical protein
MADTIALATLVRKRIELARHLTAMGLVETEGSVTVKINRGAFPA